MNSLTVNVGDRVKWSPPNVAFYGTGVVKALINGSLAVESEADGTVYVINQSEIYARCDPGTNAWEMFLSGGSVPGTEAQAKLAKANAILSGAAKQPPPFRKVQLPAVGYVSSLATADQVEAVIGVVTSKERKRLALTLREWPRCRRHDCQVDLQACIDNRNIGTVNTFLECTQCEADAQKGSKT